LGAIAFAIRKPDRKHLGEIRETSRFSRAKQKPGGCK